jgi:hypothetical protein
LNIKERDREKWLRNHNIDLDRLKATAEEEAKRELINQRVYPPTPPTKIPEDEIQKFEKQIKDILKLKDTLRREGIISLGYEFSKKALFK